MAELLLLNPRSRTKRRSTKRRVRRRNPIAALARRRPTRRRNPVAALARRRRRNPVAALARRSYRRRNPIAALARRRVSRRRRNPISLGSGSRGIVKMLMDGAIGGAGAIAVDVGWNRGVNRFLPATMQTNPAKVGAGDAIKAVLTAFLGGFLSKYTRGLSTRAAAGSLAVQARDVIAKIAPSVGMQAAGLGYYSPAQVIPMSARVGPNRAINNNGAGRGMGAYLPPGRTPLLNGSVRGGLGQYMKPGVTALLNGVTNARQRENQESGFTRR